ncbi:hypothetical protein GC093_01385 [Paenibacillus sp. LMG 31456]|uniref:Uncharacterized protein n=1 Tax=Paenibacillus foliorum TaxID=2654974 RepID=A0A972GQC6_9BACL|nr:hypothetical protein [Paenibacillus foliorum]NOU91892.1 hypothetical protein [Paenibacillus foliorum]
MQKLDFMFLTMAKVFFFDLDGCIYHTDQPASEQKNYWNSSVSMEREWDLARTTLKLVTVS